MMAGRTRTRPIRAKMTFAVTPTLPTVPRVLLMLTALTPENGVTTALSWLAVSSSLMVQSQLASQAVTELGRQHPWVHPPPFNWCQWQGGNTHARGNLLPGIGDALDRQRLKPMVPFLCGWVTHDAAAMRRDRNGD